MILINNTSLQAPLAVSPTSLPALAGIDPGTAQTLISAQAALAAGNASLVDLSKLGQLLSASAMVELQLQPILANVVDGVAEQDASTNLDAGFATLLAAAQAFVDAYNQFQGTDVNNVQDPLLAPLQNVLLLAMNESPALNDGTTLLANLAQVGIIFQDATGAAGSAQIDLTALASAFNANPAATSALLAQGFQTIAQIAAQLAAQNVDFFASDANLAPPASQFDPPPITAPPALADAAYPPPLPTLPAGQDYGLPASPALAVATAPTTAALNPQTAAASSTLPASQFEASATASPASIPDTVDAALQSTLADQALRNAFDANPAEAAPALAAAALPVEVAPPAAVQAGGGLSVTDQMANPIASMAANGVTGVSSTQALTPLAALDDGSAPLARDPSVAAAVAAYRLGDGTVPSNKPAAPGFEPNSDINAVSAVALDPRDGDARRNETARRAALTLALAENKALPAAGFPSLPSVDVTI